MAIGAGDSTISVQSTAGGFADTYGVLSVDDELVIYAGRTGSQFTGCQRGAFGTTASGHANGATVQANMVSGFITALQSAVVAIENDLGTVAARNYVRTDGAVTITGVKTFQDGAAFGTGNIAGTGLVRLPNLGAVKWRKADNSGDLGMALNASNHLAMDAIIDFAAGQTFGTFSYPDATTTGKGIVQVDATGGLAVAAGVLSLASTGVVAGTYPKVTVDAKGRATGGASLVSGDLPAHTHVATDIVSGALPFTIQKGGAAIGTRRALNFIEGANVTLTIADDSGNDRVSITVAATAHTHNATDIVSGQMALARGGTAADLSAKGSGFLRQATAGAPMTVAALISGDVTTALGYTPADRAGEHFTGPIDCGPYQTVGGAFENMAKFSEDFSVGTWDKNGGSCAVTADSTVAPDGNPTADSITAVTATPIIQQQVAGLADCGTYTFYVWAKVDSGTKQASSPSWTTPMLATSRARQASQ